MNGNGQVVVAGVFLVMSLAIAMFAVGMFENPTYELEAKPIELLPIDADGATFSPAPIELLQVDVDAVPLNLAPIELLLRPADNAEHGLTPEQFFHGTTMRALAQARAVTEANAYAHTGVCSGRY